MGSTCRDVPLFRGTFFQKMRNSGYQFLSYVRNYGYHFGKKMQNHQEGH